MTALFADLKGSTQLMEDLDPEAAHAIVDPALRIMAEAVQRYGGYVARTTGDGIFALFGAPAAYEDHPQRALYAALQMQQELRADGQRRTAKGLQSLEARVGVHTGEVVAYSVETSGKVEYRLVGHTANLAARLESLAPVGSIATSEYTRQLCEGYFELRELGPVTVKGLSTPIEVYEVTGLGPLRSHFQLAARRGLTKFVGREHELAQMRRALELAIDGQGQIVAVMAEAGTGKSRLFHEFKATIRPTCKVLEAYSVSHGKASAWLPVLELLRGYFGIHDTDDAAARRAKVAAALSALDPALEDTEPYLFGLLGLVEGPDPIAQMDPQIKRQRTLDAIKRIVLRESLQQPVVVIFEDLHWIDAQTQALLDLLADGIARARVLLLVNYRPEYRHEWTNKSYYAQLRLDPLGGAEGAAMLAALLGEGVELDPLKRLIAERTGGNPFFIEEIVQALFDAGALTRNGVVKMTRSLSQLRLPPTVQGMIAARIDRLAAEQKELLQTLAVIGRESPRGLLRQIASLADTQFERTLADLQGDEFIYEQPTTIDVEYIFKHALTQEVAYNSLLIERRKLLHERVGQAIEALFPNQLEDRVTALAHHYSHSDNADKAVEYLGRAGQQAMRRSAHLAAIGNLKLGLEFLATLPETPERDWQELALQAALGPSLMETKGDSTPEVEAVCSRVAELGERIDETQYVFGARGGLFLNRMNRGQFEAAHGIATQLLSLARASDDPDKLLVAHTFMGIILFWTGELTSAHAHFEQAAERFDPPRQRRLIALYGMDIATGCSGYAAWPLWMLGRPDQALHRTRRTLSLAQERGHLSSSAMALHHAAFCHVFRREPRIARELLEAGLALANEHGFGFWTALDNILLGRALAQSSQEPEGIAHMEEGLEAARARGLGLELTYGALAEAYANTGRAAEGLRLIGETLATVSGIGQNSTEPELHRIKGELLLLEDRSELGEAERCFRTAIEKAQRIGAKSWELRATTSLAQLLGKHGRRAEARAMLAEIYNWFTEGFDTLDLIEAKALLDELNQES
ncbi:MAG TPA: adenylate/guanylate cyclase domain-containing protein [Candidatus Binataceae bacterium]|nr:adenylate/guanylate cyclase domain-containing protein [Candidatus Binataceae bacterium]